MQTREAVFSLVTEKNLTVLVVTHRKGDLLKHSLQSLLKQTQPGDDILILDDGGHDWCVVQPYMEQVRYLHTPHNGYRLSALHNIGIQLARHDAIVKLDGDCIPQDGFLDVYRKRIKPGVLLAGRVEDMRGGKRQVDWRFDYSTRALSADMDIGPDGETPFHPHRIHSGNLGFSRQDMLEVGLWDTDFDGHWGAEDAAQGWAYHESGKRVDHLFDALAIHQEHPSEMRGDNKRNLALLKDKRGISRSPIDRPKLNVVVPHWGKRPAEKTLYPCLDRLLPLSIPARFWVVLQEPAEGVHSDVVSKFKKTHHTCTIIESPKNRGTEWPKTEVMGRISEGQFFVLVDDDIMVPPNTIEQMWAIYESLPDADVVVYDCGQIKQDIYRRSGFLRTQPAINNEKVFQLTRTGFGLSLIGPSALADCRFDDGYFCAGDLDFSLQLYHNGHNIYAYTGQKAEHLCLRPPGYNEVRFNKDHLENSRLRLEKKWKIKTPHWPM